MKSGLAILLATVVLFIIMQALTKHVDRSLQLVTLYSFIFLFFGVIKDFLELSLHIPLITKYSILLPVTAAIAILFTWSLLRKKNFRTTNLFQNTLLLIFLIIDAVRLLTFEHSTDLHKNLLIKNVPLETIKSAPTVRPDIYFLVFDSYPGTSFLSEFMNYDNSSFNKQLEDKGFYVVKNPTSNYNRTAFSIASTLNFAYLSNFKTHDYISAKNYAEANLTIKEAIVPKFLEQHGYTLYNLSVFDIDTITPLRRETFLTMTEQDVFLYNTLFQRIKKDLLWNLLVGRHANGFAQNIFAESKEDFKKEQYQKKSFNITVIDSLSKIPSHKTASPKFVYAHLYLPHPPFFYDENGNENDTDYIMTEASLENKELFLSYLRYTNKVIIQLINRIDNSSNESAVIVIQSDHGFRDFSGWQNHPEYFFTNYSAFFFPDKNYSTLYDTLSNVNTFPVILNKFFKTNIPPKKDSCIFLKN